MSIDTGLVGATGTGTGIGGGGGVSIVTLFLSFLVLVIFTLMLVRRVKFVYALRNIPAPPAAPFIGNALQLNCLQEEFFCKLFAWSKEYGDIFLLWVGMRPFIWLYRVESVQPILSSTVHIDKSFEYRYLNNWLGTGLVTSNGEKWHARRKLLTSSFHNDVMEKYLGSSIREANVLVSRLRSEIGKPEFDVLPYAKLAALDIICDTAMGYNINAQTNCTNEYVLAVDRMTSIVQKRFITFWAHPDILFNRTSWATEQQAALQIIHNFTNKVIADRKVEWKLKHDGNFNETPRKGQALLDLLLEMAQCGNSLSDEDIRDEVNTFMFAGHDTVATSVSWFLYALGRHPDYQNKILEEYDAVVGTKELTKDSLKKLEFLDACLKESWRLYPAVPLIARQIYSPIKIMGTDIPVGSTVLVNTYILHRDPRHFPRPEVFCPERFLPGNPKPQSFAFIPFSAGSRNCIGWKFAQMEVKVIVLSVLRAFAVRAIESEDQLKLVSELVLLNKNGVRLTITPRNSEGYKNNATSSMT